MFEPERDVWTSAIPFTRNITNVVGLSPLFPVVRCTEEGAICQYVTGESEINAASSTMAVALSPMFDLRETYFLIAGIYYEEFMRSSFQETDE
jgi:purine nucleoside permease